MNNPKTKIVLFENIKKKDSDPDLSGRIENEAGEIVNNVVIWLNTSKTGLEYYSGYLNPPTPKKDATATADNTGQK